MTPDESNAQPIRSMSATLMKSRLYPSFLLALAIALLLLASARGEETSNSIKFSDPTKPGTLRINLGRGDLVVEGADTSEVTLKSDAQEISAKPRKDGMRVISAASGFSFKEANNVVTVDSLMHTGGRSADFHFTVPRNTTVVVENAWGGDIRCTALSGDIEINSMHGEIELVDVSGGIVVGTMNGEIHASIRELHEGKPLSFTSMNGEVVVRVPETAKANVRFRTQNGVVLTDFADSALVTKTETTMDAGRGRTFGLKGNKVLSAELQEAIREATQISASAIREALEAVKEGLEAARIDADDAHREVEKARRELDRARREMDRERRNTARVEQGPEAPAAPKPPIASVAPTPPVAPRAPKVPTISGGKLITGTLNGGGPEISVSTMNGDVTLRKLETK